MRTEFSAIARARVGATLKCIGYCAARNVIPYTASPGHYAIIGQMTKRANELIDLVAEDDPAWLYRTQALRVAHSEYLDEGVLDQISIEETLKLRTKAWGA